MILKLWLSFLQQFTHDKILFIAVSLGSRFVMVNKPRGSANEG